MLNKQEAESMVKEHILPFWMNMLDEQNGGFYGEADFYGKINKTADKGCILNSRILWTFSSAYRVFKDHSYLEYAAHAKEFLFNMFLDKDYGGLYWLVDHTGKPVNTRKQFYNLAFGIYALSEYYLASGDESSLKLAMDLFDLLEKHSLDPVSGGYTEACTREWNNIEDLRLSEKEINCPKSMNTNLHVLEAYTTLAKASKDPRVCKSLKDLVRITMDKIINKEMRFELFFEMDWSSLSGEISYGHDIEGSWLLYEAASASSGCLAASDESLISEVKTTAVAAAEACYVSAIDRKNGGFFGSCSEHGKMYNKKEWWPQAEAVVGFYNAYELSGEKKYLNAAEDIWEYIKNNFIDHENGEWHNELNIDNTPDKNMLKAGFWKCPYHNARACFEIYKRT